MEIWDLEREQIRDTLARYTWSGDAVSSRLREEIPPPPTVSSESLTLDTARPIRDGRVPQWCR